VKEHAVDVHRENSTGHFDIHAGPLSFPILDKQVIKQLQLAKTKYVIEKLLLGILTFLMKK
jgi:hypothetical protein